MACRAVPGAGRAPAARFRPTEATVVGDGRAGAAEIFRRHVHELEGSAAIAKWLNNRVYRTRRGGPFSRDTVLRMLRNSAYAGDIEYRASATQAHTSRSFPETRSNGRRRSSTSEAKTPHFAARTQAITSSPGS